ncbi:DnaJ domain-containing protein [Lipomyces oligophaga]|uniref:DnaJ domain-containing protein n=1 Tax=Lipomyces oligophaga TaxID=45792 RepID=UPI0034D00C0B
MVLPDHYKVLGIKPDSTASQIRNAYKKAALATHPDRFNPGSKESDEATTKFQSVSDAYYVLSDPARKRTYDEQYRNRNQYANEQTYFSTDQERDREYREEFMKAFEEMFSDAKFDQTEFFPGAYPKDDVPESSPGSASTSQSSATANNASQQSTGKFYTVASGLAGSVLGFTIANVPGALAGLALGAKLGSIRDSKGKSVAQVFYELPREDRARVLADLAQKVGF